MILLLYLILPLVAEAVKYDCFQPLFPFLFGGDYGNTKITAVHIVDKPTHMRIYVGGSTSDPGLVGLSGTSPLSNPRAVVGRLRASLDLSTHTEDFSYKSGYEFFRVFKANTDIALVTALAEFRTPANQDILYALAQVKDKSEQFLVIMDSELKHLKQYVFRDPSSCSSSKKLVMYHDFIHFDSSNKLVFAFTFNDASEYGVVRLDYNFYEGATQIKTDHSSADITLFACPTPRIPDYCGSSALLVDSATVYLGALNLVRSNSIKYVSSAIHKLGPSAVDWTVSFYDTNAFETTVGSRYEFVDEMAICSNNLFFIMNEGTDTKEYFVGRLAGVSGSPSAVKIYNPGYKAVTSRKLFGLGCQDANTMYSLVETVVSSARSTSYIKFDFSSPSHFKVSSQLTFSFGSSSSYRTTFAPMYKTGSAGDIPFILVGETSKTRNSQTIKQGFLYSMNTDLMPGCYSQTPSPTLSNLAASETTSISSHFRNDLTTIPVITSVSASSNLCLKVDPDSDTSSTSQRQESLPLLSSIAGICNLFEHKSFTLMSNPSAMGPHYPLYLQTPTNSGNSTYEASALPVKVNSGSAPGECIHPFKMSWSAKKGSTTLFTDSRYPAITQEFDDTAKNWKFKMDFTDATSVYKGLLDISLKCTFPNDDEETVNFKVLGYVKCEGAGNSITFGGVQDLSHGLFNGDKTTLTWTISKALSTCTEPVTFKVQIKDGLVWNDVGTTNLATVGSFAPYPDNTVLKWELEDDNPSANYLQLKGTYDYRILAANTHTTVFDQYWISPVKKLTILGCKCTPPAITGMTMSIHGAAQVQTFPFWPVDDGLTPIECRVLSYALTYVESEDGSTAKFTDWAAKIILQDEAGVTPANKEIKTLPAGFTNNEYGGQWHKFKVTATILGEVATNSQFQKSEAFQLQINKDCSGVTFKTTDNTAAHTNIVDFSYIVGNPAHDVSIAQFVTTDPFCRVNHEIIVEKRSDSSALTTAEVNSILTFTEETQGNGVAHNLRAQITSSTALVGQYYLKIRAFISEAGGITEAVVQVQMNIKHWCEDVVITPVSIPSAEYFLEDASHLLAMAEHPQPKVISFPKFTATKTLNSVVLTEAAILSGCGAWVYAIDRVLSDGSLMRFSSPMYTKSLSDPAALSMAIRSSDKSLFTGKTKGYFVDQLALVGSFSNFNGNPARSDFSITIRDPCMTMAYTLAGFELNGAPVSPVGSPILIKHRLSNPQSKVTFPRVEQTVQILSPRTDSVLRESQNQNYCGPLNYDLLFAGNRSAVPSSMATISETSGVYTLEITETHPSFHEMEENLVLKVSPASDTTGVYPSAEVKLLVSMTNCQITSLTKPAPPTFSYFLGSGNVTFTLPRASFIPEEKCTEPTSFSASFANGTTFNSSNLQFVDDLEAGKLVWTVDMASEVYIGEPKIRLTYAAPQSKFVDDSFVSSLNISKSTFVPAITPPQEDEPEEEEEKKPLLKFSDPLNPHVEVELGRSVSYENKVTAEHVTSVVVSSEIGGDAKEFTEVKFEGGVLSVKASPYLEKSLGEHQLKFKLSGKAINGEEVPEQVLVLTIAVKKSQIIVKVPEESSNGITVNVPIEPICEPPSGASSCTPQVPSLKVGFSGEAELRFDHKMKEPRGWEAWSSSRGSPLRLDILPGSSQNSSDLDFTWSTISFEPKKMKLQLKFKRPLLISTGDKPEILKVSFVGRGAFISAVTSEVLERTSLEARVPAQMETSSSTKTFEQTTESVKTGTQVAVISNVAVNVLLSGSLQYIWGMINSLQVVFHLPGSQVGIPANTKGLYQQLIKVTQFNLLPQPSLPYFYFWRYFSGKKEDSVEVEKEKRLLQAEVAPGADTAKQDGSDEEEVSDENPNTNLVDIGYESILFVDGTETEFVLIELFFFLCLIYALLNFIATSTKRIKGQRALEQLRAFVEKMNAFLFWNLPFRFLLEGYLGLCCCALINLKPMLTGQRPFLAEDLHQKISNILAVAMFGVLAGYPFFIWWKVSKISQQQLVSNEELANRIGSLYEGLKLTFNKRGLMYNVNFTLRRLVYAATLVLIDSAWLQIIIIFLLQTWMLLYLGGHKPQDSRAINRLETFNEFLTTVLSYHLVLFTDFYTDFEVRYRVGGQSMIYLTILIIAVNMSNVLYAFYRQLKLCFVKKRKQYDRLKAKLALRLEMRIRSRTLPKQASVSISIADEDFTDKITSAKFNEESPKIEVKAKRAKSYVPLSSSSQSGIIKPIRESLAPREPQFGVPESDPIQNHLPQMRKLTGISVTTQKIDFSSPISSPPGKKKQKPKQLPSAVDIIAARQEANEWQQVINDLKAQRAVSETKSSWKYLEMKDTPLIKRYQEMARR